MKHPASIVLALILGLLIVGGALFARPLHPTFIWHNIPGYMAAIGLVSCIVVVLLSKWIGKKMLQRPEDYDDN